MIQRPTLFVIGLVLWSLLCIEITAVWALDPAMAKAALFGMGVEIVTGREGGVATALAAGVPPWLVFQLSATQDIASAFLLYPFFLTLLAKSRAGEHWLGRRLRRIEAAASAHRAYVVRWGPLGIAVFMLVPFLVNGPMVGLMLGRIAGIPTPHVLAPVIVATVVTAALWTFAFDAMFRLAQDVHPDLGAWIAAGMVALMLFLAWLDWRRDQASEDL